MQTFLPYPDFAESAAVLDRQRLGKQRVEARQILDALRLPRGTHGWQNHPAVLMWAGHVDALAAYGLAICEEWCNRGYADAQAPHFIAALTNVPPTLPPWFGGPIHLSHQAALLRKDPRHYGPIFGADVPDVPYHWPTKEAA